MKKPQYDIEKVKKETMRAPKWLHFGAGNIFRAYIGKIQQELLNKGYENTGIIVAESFDLEIIDKVYKPYNDITISTTLNKNGEFSNEIIASIVHSIKYDEAGKKELEKIVEQDSLQIISFTITEKGYNCDRVDEFENEKSALGIVTKLLYHRYKTSKKSVTLLSMDNCSGNGDRIKIGVRKIANSWVENGKIEREFLEYLDKEVGYPITMIDKITPRPAEIVKEQLEKLGFEKMDIVKTSKNSYVAPFVNAEEPEYFVVEDSFKNGRPKFEKAGVFMVDRETVEKTEKMKVTTCLNPLHTTLAIFGVLLNKKTVYDATKDELLNRLIKKVGYDEALKVVESPKILDPKAFIDEVINERFLNPYIPDQPERIATDTSQKIAIRFGETIKSYMQREDLDAKKLKYIPFVLAGWFRYLLGVDDKGKELELSKDPLLPELKEKMKNIEFGRKESYSGELKEILRNKEIFGVDLIEVGLGEKIERDFLDMIEGVGAVENSLKTILG